MKRILYILAAFAAAAACTIAPQTSESFADKVIFEFNTRQMTPEGTFAAAEARLPQLRSEGIDVLWIMPLYPIGVKERKGTLGSYYAIRDYCDVNPEFGTLEDFDHFLAEAHAQGFKVIIDWVANHTSPDHPWVTGKPAEWYVRDEGGNTVVEYDWTDIAKLNYDCPDVREEMLKCMSFWLERGIDGFRCDMAYIVPRDFWAEAIPALRAAAGRPLYFLAEGEEPWLHEVGFDTSYSWKLHHLMNDIAQGKAGAADLKEYLAWNGSEYPQSAYRLTFTSNHDENSWSGTEYDRMGDAWKLMTALCFTLPGSQPLVYTAQPLGYDHSFQFFEKDPIPAEQWTSDDAHACEAFYKQLCDTYHAHPALWPGQEGATWEYLDEDSEGEEDWITFKRTLGDDVVRVSAHLAEPWEYGIFIGEQQ